MTEFELIRRYFCFTRGGADARDIVVDIGDDAAVVMPPTDGEQLVITTDTLVEGVHFFANAAADGIAQKALAVSLSDLAAMGARPRWMTVALTAPPHPPDWFAAFARGCTTSCQHYGYAIIGGDLTRGETLSITTTAIGSTSHPPLTRAGAKTGDDIWLSAPVGEAAYAVAVTKNQTAAPPADVLSAIRQRLDVPTPRLATGQSIAGKATAGIDLSDGVLSSAAAIGEQSHAVCHLWADHFPTAASLRALPRDEFLRYVFCGGDDYELLWTAPPQHRAHFLSALSPRPHLVGRVCAANQNADSKHAVVFADDSATAAVIPFASTGYEHQF